MSNLSYDPQSLGLETILDWVRWSASRFSESGLAFGHGTDNPWDEAWFLISWAISQPWDRFDAVQLARLTPAEAARVCELVERRIEERVPAPYLTGVAWFAGYPYKVTPDVLVPRSPLAEMVLKSLEPWITEAPKRILDMCTGSGCIGIACAHQFPEAEVVLADISEAALKVAEQNVRFHAVDSQVSIVQSDGFAALSGEKFDLIISNPPYVDAEDFASMPEEFRAEPELGLVAGDDGLGFARLLLGESASHLNEGGFLVAEVGNSWPALEATYADVAFTWPELESGGHGVFVLTRDQLHAIAQ